MSFFVDKCNLLTEYQYGFREKHSTYMALLNIIDQISESLDVNKYLHLHFLDLSKAFDTIDHRIFFAKIASLCYSWMLAKMVFVVIIQIDDSVSVLITYALLYYKSNAVFIRDLYLVHCYVLMILSSSRIYFSLLCLRMTPTYLPLILTLMNY